jgi:hypothetical protein
MMAKSKPAETQHENKNKELAEKFEGFTAEDLEALRVAAEELRAMISNAAVQVIQLATAWSTFKTVIKDGRGKGKDQEQDSRVKDRATERGVEAIKNLRMYLKKSEEELRGASETIK